MHSPLAVLQQVPGSVYLRPKGRYALTVGVRCSFMASFPASITASNIVLILTGGKPTGLTALYVQGKETAILSESSPDSEHTRIFPR